MVKYKRRRIDYFFEIIIILAVLGFVGFRSIKPFFLELTYFNKAERVEASLVEIRIALEKYYQLTGSYPELNKEGAANDLTLLDYTDRDGKKISFAEIYGKNILDFTEKTDSLAESNKVIDSNDFNKIDGSGGWIYDFSNQSGEIHPNLPTNVYFQNINWSKQ